MQLRADVGGAAELQNTVGGVTLPFVVKTNGLRRSRLGVVFAEIFVKALPLIVDCAPDTTTRVQGSDSATARASKRFTATPSAALRTGLHRSSTKPRHAC